MIILDFHNMNNFLKVLVFPEEGFAAIFLPYFLILNNFPQVFLNE